MSFNPHLGDLSNSSSWETIGSNSSEESFSTLFFGGTQHTFSVFHPKSYSDITSGAKRSSFSSFGQGASVTTSLPDLAQGVGHSFEEKGAGDENDWPHYDPSELAGKSVSFDSGIDKTSKSSKSGAGKIRRIVSKFFSSSKKTPSMKSFTESTTDFPDPYAQTPQEVNKTPQEVGKTSQKQNLTSNSSIKKKTVEAKPKTNSTPNTRTSKKTSSFSGIKRMIKGSFKSSSKQPSKIRPKPPRANITKADISSPITTTSDTNSESSVSKESVLNKSRATSPKRPAPQPPTSVKTSLKNSIDPRSFEDQLKSIWTKVETDAVKTYGWVGNTVLTQGMEKVAQKILQPGDKKVSIPKGFSELRNQCNSLISKSTENARAVLCALLDLTTSQEDSFSDLLDENEGNEGLVDLFRKAEGMFTPPRMRLFLSMLADDMSSLTSSKAKSLTVSEGGIDVKLGASAVQSSLQALDSLLQGGYENNWSNSLQALVNDMYS